MASPTVRKTQGSVDLPQDRFIQRASEQYNDPVFDPIRREVRAVVEGSWDVYDKSRKSPYTRPAGKGFAHPTEELSTEWLNTSARLARAADRWKDPATPSNVLLICGSPRSDRTCPGEMSKTHRLCEKAHAALESAGMQVEYLDLSRLTSEYGRQIHPCKGCVSTAMPLCNWPCSCYPNHALGQVSDWMHEIYEKWVNAHGVMIITPVHWYQAPSVLKLMLDRLVCADGGNVDPTLTHGKDAMAAKKFELDGWDYPKHLADRLFSVNVHGDAGGTEGVKDALTNLLQDMGLLQAAASSNLARYIGYYEPYATSHESLDKDEVIFKEIEASALTLSEAVKLKRSGRLPEPGRDFRPPRQK